MLFAVVFHFFVKLLKPHNPNNLQQEAMLRSAQEALASKNAWHAVRLEQLRAALY